MEISLKWFKSKIKQMFNLSDESEKTEQPNVEPVKQEVVKEVFYKSCKYVNGMLTVVMKDGDVKTISECSKELHEQVVACTSLEDFLLLIASLNATEQEPEPVIQKDNGESEPIYAPSKEYSDNLKKTDSKFSQLLTLPSEFIVDGKSVYFKGVKRSLPTLLIAHISKIVDSHTKDGVTDLKKLVTDKGYIAVKRFFFWACGNSRPEVADQLYDFLMKNNMRITKHGMFVAIRNVVKVNGKTDKVDSVDFISNAFNKIKAVWKKNPKNFSVYSQGKEYGFIETSKIDVAKFKSENKVVLGVLSDLYAKLPTENDENRYTDNHTKKFDIRVGKLVSMKPEDCSWSTADCGERGLHFTGNAIHYVACGETAMLILINPMKVVGIGSVKGRCYEYLPIMTVPRNEADKILHDLNFDTLELDDSFAANELDKIEARINRVKIGEKGRYQFERAEILDSESQKTVIPFLEEMQNELSKRIQKIV